ncbi:hypothetical protein HN011_002228 [Eciton burchellii]|nr:hypothetical protein HN011_002228 [Eciton burchellii]
MIIARDAQINYIRARIAKSSTNISYSSTKLSMTMIMDLLDHFSANTANFDNWEQQLILLKKTYKLIENYTRVLINMKLKGTGVIPFQSHPYGRFQ